MTQLISRDGAILNPRTGTVIATVDPRRAKAALIERGCSAAAADAIALGYAVLSDPYPSREWKFNTKER